ncbi:MAG: glutamate--cysteine ligase [Proteobacteria bacterium]|nr:glutamate--cysteine ligase [Pseudomonadota bacterium]
MGMEFESLIFAGDFSRRATAKEIQSLLALFQKTQGTFIKEGEEIIGLDLPAGALTLEPGGQFEFSAPPLARIAEVAALFEAYQRRLVASCEALGLKAVSMGYDPVTSLEERFWMPKARYKVMAPYMLKKGTLGQEMMTGTCTTQINLDYASEADMVRKMRVAMALQPLATALFANSPLVKGEKTHYLSYRRHIWNHTDPDRCGLLAFVFEDNMGFERYADYALSVPMYFVKRRGAYINVAGRSFRDFLAGNLPELPGEKPLMQDWLDHLTTLFPEVRLKNVLELRGADSAPFPQVCQLAALWAGLLYDEEALQAAHDLVMSWDVADIMATQESVPVEGLASRIGKATLQEIARDILPMAKKGLGRLGEEEAAAYLLPLEDVARTGRVPAHALLESRAKEKDMAAFMEQIALS